MTSLLLSTAALSAQAFYDDPAEGDNSAIYEAYQQQLKENKRRLSDSEDAYQQQLQANQAAQIYVPPVHISPEFPPPTRPNRSLNGRVNSVQSYVAPSKPAYASLSDEQRKRRSNVAASPRQKRNSRTSSSRPAAASSTEHVFLQDRIANALSRTFGRKSKSTEVAVHVEPVSPPELQPIVRKRDSHHAHDIRQRKRPVVESVELNQYAAAAEKWTKTPRKEVAEKETGQPLRSILDQSETDVPEKTNERQADLQLADNAPPNVFIPDNSTEDDSRVVPSSYEVERRRTSSSAAKKSVRVAKRAHRLRGPRPVSYRPKQRKLRASGVSVLVGQEEDLDDLDFNPPLDREDIQDSFSDEELSSPLRPKEGSDTKSGSGTKPDQRDDLESMEDDDLEKDLEDDRIRSRLNDDLDDLDDLDDIDDEDFGDEELEVARPTDRPCNDFRDELLSTSIRDIALDISPPAYSESSRYGGPVRSWTDRSGNVIAEGTMVDLRRGYVILDSGQKIPYSKLGVSDLAAVSDFWRLPTVCLLGNRGGSPYRSWAQQSVTWKASSLCHKPLYFENRQLERYGHSRGPFAQPLHSTAHFFVSLVSLPYQSAINPPNECQYALGFFRPGGCAPWLKDPVPISLEAAGRQALITTGAAFIP